MSASGFYFTSDLFRGSSRQLAQPAARVAKASDTPLLRYILIDRPGSCKKAYARSNRADTTNALAE